VIKRTAHEPADEGHRCPRPHGWRGNAREQLEGMKILIRGTDVNE
jgi:hypothetical protein